MNLITFPFPKVSDAEIVFSTQLTIPALLKEAKKRGFYAGDTPYNKLFSQLFFYGGKLKFKKDLPEDFVASAMRYMKSFMCSFEPKHEEKEAICAMLLSELAECKEPPCHSSS